MSQTALTIDARRRPGTPQQWPAATSLDDSSLGLSFENLTALWAPFGLLPAGWSDEMAAELRRAVHRIASLAIGEMSGKRTRWSTIASALALTMTTDVDLAELSDDERVACGVGDAADATHDDPGHAPDDGGAGSPVWNGESPFEVADEHQTLKRLRIGWGTGPGALRLLHNTTGEAGVALPVTGDDAQSRRRRRGPTASTTVEPERWWPVDDGGEALDRLWSRWRRHRTLPVEVCAAFMAPLRSLDLATDGEGWGAETITLPSMWQLVATMLVEGPARTRQRLLRLIAQETQRSVAPRVDRPEGGGLAEGSLANRVDGAQFWMDLAHRISPEHPDVLGAWGSKVELDVDLSDAAQWVADRRAVPLPVYRRARHALKSKLDARRRDGRLDLDDHVFLAWRDLLLLCLAGETGARAGEIAALRPASFDKIELDGNVVPVVLIKPLKQRRRTAQRARRHRPLWPQTISEETYALVREWIEHFELTRDDDRSIWIARKNGTGRVSAAGLSRRCAGSKDGTRALLPRLDGNGGYSLHCVRHLVETLSFSVGSAWLAANQSWQERVSAQVFAAAKTIHAMPHDAHGYKDYEANAELWQHRTAVGDPEHGVAGLLDAAGGQAGARRGWDVEAIRAAHWTLERTQRDLDEATATLARLRLERTELAKRRLPSAHHDFPRLHEAAVLPEGQALVELVKELHSKLDVLGARDLAREQREADRDELDAAIEAAHERHSAAAQAHRAAATKLKTLRAAGRTAPLPDSTPTAEELRRDHEQARREGAAPVPLEAETWEDAVARAAVPLARADEEEPLSHRIRRHLNMPEFAAVLGISDSALRKRLRGASPSPFPLEGDDSPLVVMGHPPESKLRFIDVDRLPASFVRALLPEQRDMIEQLLAVPMGSTRWRGRALPASAFNT